MEITPNKRKIVLLVEEAHQGSICLPNFQRDFVWSSDEIADLLRSLLRGYFVGSLLLLNCDKTQPPFAPVALRGAEPLLTTLAPSQLVLDGQQRLTSLIYSLYAPELPLRNSKKPRAFFVNLDALTSDPDSDDIVTDFTEREAVKEGLDSRTGQYQTRRIPATALISSSAFLTWRDGYDDWLRETDPVEHERFRSGVRDTWQKAIDSFLSFEVPLVELPIVKDDDQEAVARVCAIFEKLNSTGVELSVYDLLTARLYRSQVDLHALWDEAVQNNPRLAHWSGGQADKNKFGVLVLRTMALLRDLDPKPKILINLAPKNFEEDWRHAARAMDRALVLLETVGPDGFGVFDQKWLPGYGLVPVLAALRAHIEDHKLDAQAREDLRRWYWSSVFLERYSSAVESKSRRDYLEYTRKWSGDSIIPQVIAEAEQRIGSTGFTIATSASNASAVYSGVFCMMAIDGARDWSANEQIALQNLEDHHIFPRNYLGRHGFDAKRDRTLINSIVNRTLIANSTNGTISAQAPHDYLNDSRVFHTDPAKVLGGHFVNEEALALMRSATDELDADQVRQVYSEFSRIRERTLIERIRQLCGVSRTHSQQVDDD